MFFSKKNTIPKFFFDIISKYIYSKEYKIKNCAARCFWKNLNSC